MKLKLTSVFVQDQAAALRFYTEILGFVKKADLPLGEARWLTVVSPEGPEDLELLLEPLGHPAAPTFQAAMFEAGIPLAAFATEDIQRDYERLAGQGVTFRMPPIEAGPATVAVFEDTCGNLLQLYQV